MAFAQRSWRDIGGSGQSGNDQVCFNRIVLAAMRRTGRGRIKTVFLAILFEGFAFRWDFGLRERHRELH